MCATLAHMQTTTAQIAAIVRGAVAEQGLTQKQVAGILRIDRHSVSERLRGRRPFTAAELLVLAHSMRVPVSRLYPAERAA